MGAPGRAQRFEKPYTLTTTRTMQALEALDFEPASAPRLGDALGVHPVTARRLLGALTDAR